MTLTNPAATALRIACFCADELTGAALTQTLAALVPGAAIEATVLASVRNVPDADCAVLDGSASEAWALDTLRTMRARGFKAPTILIVATPIAPPTQERLRLGITHVLDQATLVTALPGALREATRMDEAARTDHTLAQALRTLRQTQRLLAAGEIAMKLQHSLNNPLAALLAEAQLLELEDLETDHRRSVERIIELSRRLIEVTRTLEGIGGSR